MAQAAAAMRASESSTATGTVAKEVKTEAPPAPEPTPPPEETPAAEAETTSAETESTEEAAPAEEAQPTEEETADPDVLSPKSSLTKEQQLELNARIAKERRKRGDLERRNEELLTRLSAIEQQVADSTQKAAQQIPAPTLDANDPLGNIHDPRQLEALKQQAKEAIRFAEGLLETPKAWRERDDPNGGDPVRYVTVGNQEWTEDMVRETRRQARITMEDYAPAREKFLEARSKAEQQALQKFPFLKDRSSPDYLLAQQIYRTNPWLQKQANAAEIVALQIKGIRATEAEDVAATAAAKAKAEKPKPKVAVRPASDQAAVSTTGQATRAPSATGAKRGLETEQSKMAAKRGITAEEATASLLRSERFRNAR